MGCGGSKEDAAPKKANGKAKEAKPVYTLTSRQMTVGELQDSRLKHNEKINELLEDAKEELVACKGKWIWDDYTDDGRLLGRGACARVSLGRQKGTNKLVAIRFIAKTNKFYDLQQRVWVSEIACMRALQGHRNMVALYDLYKQDEGDYVVLEYMPSRLLFDAIVSKHHFGEADAAIVMKQLLEFLHFMHERNIVHRDIKPENLLLYKPKRATYLAQGGDPDNTGADSDDDDETKANKLPWLTKEEETLVDDNVWADIPDGFRLKVIDYGTAVFCEQGQHLHSKTGTARYIAPEVLNRDYDKSSDIWSAGVVLYVLLSGHMPFRGATDAETMAKVKTGQYSFDSEEWEHVSSSAKDMVRHMMELDPTKRWTAKELLEHVWFQEAPEMVNGIPNAARDGYLSRLRGFAGMNRMKRLALKLLASENQNDAVTMAEVARLKKLFNELDTDGDGLIDGGALHRGLATVGCNLSARDVREFLAVSAVDTHQGTGQIDINEFIAALFDSEKVVSLHPDIIEAEFKRLDADGDGIITASDLVKASAAGGGACALLGESVALTQDEATSILEELVPADKLMETGEQKLGLNLEQFYALFTKAPNAKLSGSNPTSPSFRTSANQTSTFRSSTRASPGKAAVTAGHVSNSNGPVSSPTTPTVADPADVVTSLSDVVGAPKTELTRAGSAKAETANGHHPAEAVTAPAT